MGTNKDAAVEAIFQKIAGKKIPFMDIASGERMGLAPYIMKLNPESLNICCINIR